uniref:Ig-like domain-containing protein n=1 Tax=Eptatretus burgeri TaxID=7764 RepID=A0A8C4WYA8_EPTBU
MENIFLFCLHAEIPVMFRKTLEEEVTLFEGQPLLLSAELNKERDVTWKIDDKPLKCDFRISASVIGTQHFLTFQSSRLTDQGTYTIATENIQCSSKVTVLEIKREWFVRGLQNQKVPLKHSAVFEAELTADTPKIKWMKGEEEIKPSDKYDIQKDGKIIRLVVKSAEPEDVGEFTVEVEGQQSKAELAIEVPCFTTKLQDFAATEKEPITLECETNLPDVPSNWFKDGKPIKPSKNLKIKADGHRHILSIKKLERADKGMYTCDIVYDQTSATLAIEGDFQINKTYENTFV